MDDVVTEGLPSADNESTGLDKVLDTAFQQVLTNLETLRETIETVQEDIFKGDTFNAEIQMEETQELLTSAIKNVSVYNSSGGLIGDGRTFSEINRHYYHQSQEYVWRLKCRHCDVSMRVLDEFPTKKEAVDAAAKHDRIVHIRQVVEKNFSPTKIVSKPGSSDKSNSSISHAFFHWLFLGLWTGLVVLNVGYVFAPSVGVFQWGHSIADNLYPAGSPTGALN